MRTAIFIPGDTQRILPRQAAAEEGLNRCGVETIRFSEPKGPARLPAGIDFALAGGLHGINQLLAAASGRALPVLIVELGYMKRANNNETDGYYQLGWNKLCDIPAEVPSSDRWEALGLEVLDNKAGGEHILVAGQVGGDAQHGLPTPQLVKWLMRTSVELEKKTGLPRVWRPHPKQGNLKLTTETRIARQDPLRVPLESALDKAAHVVTFNSTLGVEALRRGIPVECDPGAHYARVAKADRSEREAFLKRVAYAQWLLSEIASGEAVRFCLGRMPR